MCREESHRHSSIWYPCTFPNECCAIEPIKKNDRKRAFVIPLARLHSPHMNTLAHFKGKDGSLFPIAVEIYCIHASTHF